ncbi:MAG: hypothetical protein LBK72_07760 [Bifidobacteriaceae bacterium]|nr:hypothetical protein [Bifidobacteriaceae bacterium]
MRRVLKALVLVVVLVVAVGVGWWAGRVSFSAVDDASGQREESYYSVTVVDGSVGEVRTVSVTVERPEALASLNYLEGTVNAVNGSGVADVGEMLFEVSGVPVRAVVCERPFFRDMVEGAEGRDVACLHGALMATGFLNAKDGKGSEFTAATKTAVKRWQKDLGIRQTGLVNLGELVGFEALPAGYRLGEAIEPARRLAGGEEAVFASVGDPLFEVRGGVSDGPGVEAEARVTVTSGDRHWDAIPGASVVRQDEGMDVVAVPLTAPDGGVVCGEECDQVPPGAMVSLFAEVEVVPPASGPSVPAAAVRTDTAGQAYVTMVDETRRTVEVVGAGRGIVVVSGLEIGEQVLVDDDAADGADSSPDRSVWEPDPDVTPGPMEELPLGGSPSAGASSDG